MSGPDKNFKRGFEARVRMFGLQKTEAALAQTGACSLPFQQLMTANCFGMLWADDVISQRDRSLITMCLLAAMGKAAELKAHVILAIANGVETDVLVEMVKHVAVYCGIPSGSLASAVVQEVLNEQAS